MKRLVLFVEGQADVHAVPALISKLQNDLPDELKFSFFVDSNAYVIGGFPKVPQAVSTNWKNKLKSAQKRRDFGGVLLVLDAEDCDREGKRSMCVAEVARELSKISREVGGGAIFSVAIAFIVCEFESLLIAGYESLPGKKDDVTIPPNVEKAPRDAKGWLAKNLDNGYRCTRHQVSLTKSLDLTLVRSRELRCFAHLEKALKELALAFASGSHITMPMPT